MLSRLSIFSRLVCGTMLKWFTSSPASRTYFRPLLCCHCPPLPKAYFPPTPRQSQASHSLVSSCEPPFLQSPCPHNAINWFSNHSPARNTTSSSPRLPSPPPSPSPAQASFLPAAHLSNSSWNCGLCRSYHANPSLPTSTHGPF